MGHFDGRSSSLHATLSSLGERFQGRPVAGVVLEEPVRIKQVYFHLPDGLVPAYYVEVITNNATGEVMLDTQFDESAYAYAISAVDGSFAAF